MPSIESFWFHSCHALPANVNAEKTQQQIARQRGWYVLECANGHNITYATSITDANVVSCIIIAIVYLITIRMAHSSSSSHPRTSGTPPHVGIYLILEHSILFLYDDEDMISCYPQSSSPSRTRKWQIIVTVSRLAHSLTHSVMCSRMYLFYFFCRFLFYDSLLLLHGRLPWPRPSYLVIHWILIWMPYTAAHNIPYVPLFTAYTIYFSGFQGRGISISYSRRALADAEHQ